MYGGIPNTDDSIHQSQMRGAPSSKSHAGERPAGSKPVTRANMDPSYAIGPLPSFQRPAGGEVDKIGEMVDRAYREAFDTELRGGEDPGYPLA